MICEKTVKNFCCEDISLIENYKLAINSKEIWHCHHRLETDFNITKKELIETGRYYNVEAKYLIFLTEYEHMSLHQKMHNNFIFRKNNGWTGKHRSENDKNKISESCKKPKLRYKYLTPNGEIKEMSVNAATRHHPDWKKIGEV